MHDYNQQKQKGLDSKLLKAYQEVLSWNHYFWLISWIHMFTSTRSFLCYRAPVLYYNYTIRVAVGIFFLIFKWITENMWLVEIKPHPQSPSQYFARQGVVPQRVTDHDWLCNLGHIFQHEKTETKHVIAEKYLRK